MREADCELAEAALTRALRTPVRRLFNVEHAFTDDHALYKALQRAQENSRDMLPLIVSHGAGGRELVCMRLADFAMMMSKLKGREGA